MTLFIIARTLAVIAAVCLLQDSCAAQKPYLVEPIGRTTNVTVLVTALVGWSKNLTPDMRFRVGFSPAGQKGPPYLGLVAFARDDSYYQHLAREPQNFLEWETENEPTNIAVTQTGTFDAGIYGTLPVWRAHAPAGDFIVTVFTLKGKRTQIAIYLRGPNAKDLLAHLESLKEMARSVRTSPK